MKWFRRKNDQLRLTLNMGTTVELHKTIDERGGRIIVNLLDGSGAHIATISITRPE